MRGNVSLILLTVVFAGISFVPVTAESVVVYSDRGDWEAAVTTVRMVENFESESLGTFGTPYQTTSGINVERFGMFVDLTVRDSGVVDNSREMLIQDYGARTFFTFPSNRRQLGFGFDWVTGSEAWTLKFSGEDYTLAANSSGFIGLVDAAGESYGFELTAPDAVQDGLAIDNLEFSPALLVFTNRTEWEAALGRAPVAEGFEADTPGTYQTPYTTGGGCDLVSLGVAFDVNVNDSGLINGSRELQFKDYGEQLSFSFPGGRTQRGFGFDWKTLQEYWNLIIRSEHIGLSGGSEGFIGVVDQTQQTVDFILSSTIVVQQGVVIDNLSYSDDTVPLVRVTWGSIKSKYE